MDEMLNTDLFMLKYQTWVLTETLYKLHLTTFIYYF